VGHGGAKVHPRSTGFMARTGESARQAVTGDQECARWRSLTDDGHATDLFSAIRWAASLIGVSGVTVTSRFFMMLLTNSVFSKADLLFWLKPKMRFAAASIRSRSESKPTNWPFSKCRGDRLFRAQ
jgi:hypothetical protein